MSYADPATEGQITLIEQLHRERIVGAKWEERLSALAAGEVDIDRGTASAVIDRLLAAEKRTQARRPEMTDEAIAAALGDDNERELVESLRSKLDAREVSSDERERIAEAIAREDAAHAELHEADEFEPSAA